MVGHWREAGPRSPQPAVPGCSWPPQAAAVFTDVLATSSGSILGGSHPGPTPGRGHSSRHPHRENPALQPHSPHFKCVRAPSDHFPSGLLPPAAPGAPGRPRGTDRGCEFEPLSSLSRDGQVSSLHHVLAVTMGGGRGGEVLEAVLRIK